MEWILGQLHLQCWRSGCGNSNCGSRRPSCHRCLQCRPGRQTSTSLKIRTKMRYRKYLINVWSTLRSAVRSDLKSDVGFRICCGWNDIQFELRCQWRRALPEMLAHLKMSSSDPVESVEEITDNALQHFFKNISNVSMMIVSMVNDDWYLMCREPVWPHVQPFSWPRRLEKSKQNLICNSTWSTDRNQLW